MACLNICKNPQGSARYNADSSWHPCSLACSLEWWTLSGSRALVPYCASEPNAFRCPDIINSTIKEPKQNQRLAIPLVCLFALYPCTYLRRSTRATLSALVESSSRLLPFSSLLICSPMAVFSLNYAVCNSCECPQCNVGFRQSCQYLKYDCYLIHFLFQLSHSLPESISLPTKHRYHSSFSVLTCKLYLAWAATVFHLMTCSKDCKSHCRSHSPS